MKKYLLAVILSILVNVSFAQYCDIVQAEKVAENTITERFNGISKVKSDYKIINSLTYKYNDTEVLHIFNLAPQGFVIISAEQSTEPIVAFSTESEFIPENINSSVAVWLKNYAAQIEFDIKNNIQASVEIQNKWDRLSKNPNDFEVKSQIRAIAPMLTTKWDQGRYFNTQCPADPAGTDGHVVVGCVATALGQLMNYFRYPTTGTGSYGYEHPDYGWLEVNFAEQNYNYDQMPATPTDYNDDMARLLYNIGVSVDMNYGPDGSGMYNHKGAYTLRTYFGYNTETTYYFRDSVDAEFNWTDTLIMHLDQNIPLYYAGWSDYDFIMGHAFILDGYSDETHYHINWGWSGSQDGYFMIDDLTPSGSDFTLLHEVIAYAVPASTPEYCTDQKELVTIEGIIEDGSGPINFYQNDSDCSWLINPADSVSGISFEFLKLVADNEDYLIVYDGPNDTYPILQTIFGGDNPSEFESTADQVLVRFVTNSDSVNDGWLLKYIGIKPEYCAVSSTLTAESGIITDGSNSYMYQNGEFCNWVISPAGAENILITFLEFDIEPVLDWVKILNSSNQTVATLSGSALPEPVLITGNKATVTFRSNTSVRAGGFKLQYETNVTNSKLLSGKGLNVYPNPAKDKIFVESEMQTLNAEIIVYNYDGKVCRKFETAGNSHSELSLDGLSSGLYIMEIKSVDSIDRIKFIKE